MEVFGKLREKSGVIKALVRWQSTMWYPFVFALLGVVSALFGVYAYVPVFYLYTVSVIFAVLFNDDLKVYLTPLLLIFFAVGKEGMVNFDQTINDTMSMFSTAGFVQMVVCASVMFVAFLWKLWTAGVLRELFRKRGAFTFGLLLLGGAFLLNGAFSPTWEPLDLAYGVLEAVGILIFYLIVSAWISRCEDVAAYACKIMIFLGLMISCEVGILSWILGAQGKLFVDGVFQRDNISFGWGFATLAGGAVALAIPAAMYLAHSRKHGTFAYLLAVAFFAMLVYLQSRASILFGGIALAAGAVVCCVSGKNRVANRYFTVILVGLALAGLAFILQRLGGLSELFDKLKAMDFLHMSSGLNGRGDRWLNGWDDFTRAPVFGVGILDGGNTGEPSPYLNMYHNIFIELAGATGIVGCIAFIVHFKKFAELGFRGFTGERLLLWCVPFLVILMSVFDNFFFMINMQLYYGTFLAIVEQRAKEESAARVAGVGSVPYGAKPRVAVIRAGEDGGLTTALRAKLDGVAEVTEIELPDALCGKKSGGFAGVCRRIGVFLLGDRLAARLGVANRTGKAFRQRLADGGYHAVVTTHFAAATLASGLTGKHRPYVALVCLPDRFDGRMDADVNDWIFLSEKDGKKAARLRWFALGNWTAAEGADGAAELLAQRVASLPKGEKSELAEV